METQNKDSLSQKKKKQNSFKTYEPAKKKTSMKKGKETSTEKAQVTMDKIMKSLKIEIELERKRINIIKGSETIWIDVCEDERLEISATSRNGGYMVATLKFLDDQVVLIE